MQKLEQWNLLIKLLQGANEDQKKMVDLVIHYRDEKEILDPTIAGYFLLAIGLGKNPFADEMLLKYLVTGIKSKNLGIHYLSNEFLDRDHYYRLYSETLDKCEICGSWYKEVCDVCLNRAIDAFMEAEQNDLFNLHSKIAFIMTFNFLKGRYSININTDCIIFKY